LNERDTGHSGTHASTVVKHSRHGSRTSSRSYAEALQGLPPNDATPASPSQILTRGSGPQINLSAKIKSSMQSIPLIQPGSPLRTPKSASVATEGSESQKCSGLRATAASFVPDLSKLGLPITWALAAEKGCKQDGPPPVEFLRPWAIPKESPLGLRDGYGYNDVDPDLLSNAFGETYRMHDYNLFKAKDISWDKRVPWCTVVPRLYANTDVLGTDEFKVQVPEIPEQENLVHTPNGLTESPELSLEELQRRDEMLTTTLLQHAITEAQRTLTSLALNGPGPYPHTMPSTRALTEDLWQQPIGPNSQYTGFNILPHPRAKEWRDVSTAVKLINHEYGGFVPPPGKWWEPEIPTGFDKRALHNQPGRSVITTGPALNLRGGGSGDEWDWINTFIQGCEYCGNPDHGRSKCTLWAFNRQAEYNGDLASDKSGTISSNCSPRLRAHCLSCNSTEHFLRECTVGPVFDDGYPRFKKLQYYAHTEHWRDELRRHHELYAPRKGLQGLFSEEKLQTVGVGDAARVFTWFPCGDCSPEGHWGEILDTIEYVKWLCEQEELDVELGEELGANGVDEERQKMKPFSETPNWLVEYESCPVIWNVMHAKQPGRAWAVLNPMNSVAVDAFWRVALRAMGWDVPRVDETVVPPQVVL
jgi:hypothetical protein